ncbi:MAG: (2Fe-2S) ferredoxin domain-containing protein [Clostridia bacterium]|nr:(2Fe-2S) ferredoxin domain-containing protein [Clostridia bacterium]
MKIVVCIGSSCHLKGSRQVVERLRELIEKYSVGDRVELGGTFCIGECQKGVCVTVDDAFHSVTPENVDGFFAEEVIAKLG